MEGTVAGARLGLAFAGAYGAWLLGRGRPRPAARKATLAEHDAAVEQLARAVAAGPPPFALRKRGLGHQARRRRAAVGTVLDLRPLDRLVELDPAGRTATVEPQVTIRELVRSCAVRGLAPAVIPEFPDITVGGAVQGLAAESTCHRAGLFHEAVESLEVVLGDGRRVELTREHEPELFAAVPGSYGTLAILVGIRLRLVANRPWLRLTHRRSTVEEIASRPMPWPCDVVDAVCDRGEEAVVTTGELVDRPEPGEPVWWDRPAGPYYCDHVMSTGNVPRTELMAFEQYAFRYDRGAFWVGPEKLGRSAAARLAFGGFATAANLYRLRRARQRLDRSASRRVVQDCIVPAAAAAELLRFVRRATAGPLWLLPIRSGRRDLLGLSPGPWVNVGIYLRVGRTPAETAAFNRELDRRVAALGGVTTLHAEVSATAAELRERYDLDAYDDLRRRSGAVGALPHLLEVLGVAGSGGR